MSDRKKKGESVYEVDKKTWIDCNRGVSAQRSRLGGGRRRNGFGFGGDSLRDGRLVQRGSDQQRYG